MTNSTCLGSKVINPIFHWKLKGLKESFAGKKKHCFSLKQCIIAKHYILQCWHNLRKWKCTPFSENVFESSSQNTETTLQFWPKVSFLKSVSTLAFLFFKDPGLAIPWFTATVYCKSLPDNSCSHHTSIYISNSSSWALK